jgi:hypothetical protein
LKKHHRRLIGKWKKSILPDRVMRQQVGKSIYAAPSHFFLDFFLAHGNPEQHERI